MSHEKPRISLCMIVKNEAHVIERCLRSVKDLLSYWVIVDTGSTDGTPDVIQAALSDLPGELHHRPWKDFGHNRTESLELARGKADYTLVIDADEVLERAEGFTLPPLTADAYALAHQNLGSTTRFELLNLVRSNLPFRYEGVLHEYMTCDVPFEEERLPGLTLCGHFDSARNANADKYLRDVRVLEAALREEPNNARHVFYLAQSYRDAGLLAEAIDCYERRVEMGGWWEEVYCSMLAAASGREALGDWPRAEAGYLRALAFRPQRAEPLCALARHHREAGNLALAHVYASAAVARPRPVDRLFVDASVYEWRAKDELAVSAYHVGRMEESLALNRALLLDGHLPETEWRRVKRNLALCLEALGDSHDTEAHRVQLGGGCA